ncbi:MAG: trimethylamine methyltransferase family protein [Planctomycetota bacterium]
MLKGILRVLEPDDMNRIHAAALRVLEDTGLQLRGRFLLEALADARCPVDFEKSRARFRPDLVEKQIASQRGRCRMVRSSLWYPFCRELPEDDVAWPDEFAVDFGFATPSIYDLPRGAFRSPTRDDQLAMIALGNALPEVKAVCSPLILGDVDPRIETIESSRLLLLNTRKPGWVGTSSAKEVKFLAEFAALAVSGDAQLLRTRPPIFVNAYCTTSPLKLDTRSCEVLREALRFGFPVNFASMPILGATTPVTPAGSIVVAAAEILGCITAASLIAPDLLYYATAISGEMDMKTTQVCYAAPAAILTDAALHQLFRYKYGIVLNVEPAYVEAKHPGIQAAFMKTFRQMALGATAALSLPVGALDNASAFSPAQAMIDLDVNRALYAFARGVTVSDDTLCPDLIREIAFCDKSTYLETDHTLRHFRDVLWDPLFFDRAYRPSPLIDRGKADEELVRKADASWRDLVAQATPTALSPAFIAEVERIAAAARRELLD